LLSIIKINGGERERPILDELMKDVDSWQEILIKELTKLNFLLKKDRTESELISFLRNNVLFDNYSLEINYSFGISSTDTFKNKAECN
jgi:hypothetical protein